MVMRAFDKTKRKFLSDANSFLKMGKDDRTKKAFIIADLKRTSEEEFEKGGCVL